MMSPRPFLFAVAAIAVAVGSTAATVSPAFASPAARSIAYDDLNLASARGRAVLEARIANAARMICGTALTVELDIAAGVNACRADVTSQARQQIAGSSVVRAN